MVGAVLTAAAKQDLVEIYQYSWAKWGVEQADKYLAAIDDAIVQVLHYPHLGSSRDEVLSGNRVVFVGRHAIYYRYIAEIVHIDRVLHQSMDPHQRF